MDGVQLLEFVVLGQDQYFFIELLDGLVVLGYLNSMLCLQNSNFLTFLEMLVALPGKGLVELFILGIFVSGPV